MKKLKLYLERIENTVVMRVLEQEGINKDLSEKVCIAEAPDMGNSIYLRGYKKNYDNRTICKIFDTNKQAEEYLQKVIGWLDEVFAEPVEPKRGDKVIVWDDDIKNISKRIFLAKIEGADYPYITVFRDDEKRFIEGMMFKLELFKHIIPLKSGYNPNTKIYEGEIE